MNKLPYSSDGTHPRRSSSCFPPACISTCGTFHFTRLNGDSSWLVECCAPNRNRNTGETKEVKMEGTSSMVCRIVIDPWFEDSPAVLGCPCFSFITEFPAALPSVDVDDILSTDNTSSMNSNYLTSENESPRCAENNANTTDDHNYDDNDGEIRNASTINAIVISLPFPDHCHEDTLDTFPPSIPIIAANGSYRRLKAYYGESRNIIELPSSDCGYESGACIHIPGSPFDIVAVQSKRGSLIDPAHRGILITHSLNSARVCKVEAFNEDLSEEEYNSRSETTPLNSARVCKVEAFNEDLSEEECNSRIETTSRQDINDTLGHVLYAPHGLQLSHTQKSRILSLAPNNLCLLSTTTLYEFPLFLGGPVHLGVENVSELIRDLNVIDFIPTHSSSILRRGMLSKIGKEQAVDVESEAILQRLGKGVMRIAKKPTYFLLK